MDRTQHKGRLSEAQAAPEKAQVFERLKLAPAYQLVSETIERQVLEGYLRAGARLPSETELAQQFGVNRSTVREGIRLLEHAGLVKREGKKLLVTLPHYMELASRASRALVMHQVTFRELWEASMAIEPIVARYAAKRITREQIDALKDNIRESEKNIKDIDAFIGLDIAFHDMLASATRNRALVLAREAIGLLFMPAGKAILPRLHTQRRVIDAHKQILALLEKRDAAAAEAWMKRHMADFKRGYERTGLGMDQALDTNFADP